MNKLKTSLVAGLTTLLFLSPTWQDTTLKDIAKPYLGAYECTQAHLGSHDCLDRFTEIRLELKDEENYLLYYKEKRGKRKTVEGKYRYDKQAQAFFIQDEKTGIERSFPLVDGKLTVSFPVGGKTMVLQFERK